MHLTPSMFGKLSGACLEVVVVMWDFEQRTVYVSSLEVKLILTCSQESAKMKLALNKLKQVPRH